jgi:thiamine-phosphate pyrophosphorylase
MTPLPRLYAVADGGFGNPVELARALFDGGARLVQIRHKGVPTRILMNEVDEVLKYAPGNSQVIVNDRADVARLAGAAGVHLGQEDLPPSSARFVLAERQILGYSTHNLAQALAADNEPVDYIAVGPVFATATKENAAPVLGLERLREICLQVRKPVVAIGGITLASAQEVLNCGVASVAVIGDILRCEDVRDRTREWAHSLQL